MNNPDLFEEMLTTYPAEKRELARAVYHRFAEGDSTQFFSQLFLLLDVYAHYAERIPARMISANADSLATVQELREEVGLLAKAIEARDANITEHAEKTDALCRATQEKCSETIAAIELTVKNLGAQVDTKAIAQGVSSALESRIKEGIIAPFVRQTESLVLYVFPTLKSIRESAEEAKSAWSKRIWKTAWTTSSISSVLFALVAIAIAWWAIDKYYQRKIAAQAADMAQVVKFNQAAFHKLAIAQVPIKVLPTPNDGSDSPPGFVLVIEGAYAAVMRKVDGQNDGCIFFRSSVPDRQIRLLQQDSENQPQGTNSPAK
jgi:hypothetical protein